MSSKMIAYVGGGIMAIAGIWGFIAAPVLGIFDANAATAVLWLVAGIIVLAVAMWAMSSLSMTFKIYGIVLAILAVWGFVIPGDILGMFTNTGADNVLHAVLALWFLYGGFMGMGGMSSSSMSGTSGPTAM